MNRQIYKMTISDTADSITFYLLDVPIVKKNVEGTATNTTIDGNVFTDYMWLKDQWEQKWSIMCNPEWSKLDAIYKRQFSDADVPTLKVFYGDNIYTDGSAEGSSFQIMNDSEVYEGEIRGFSLYGNATQETLSGKNLLYIATGTHTSGGLTWVITEDTITISGTATGTISNGTYFALPSSLAPGQYRLAISQAISYGIRAMYLEPDGTTSHNTNAIPAGGTYATATTSWTTARIRIGLFGWGNGDSINISFPNRVMFSAGSEVEPYEPYCGGVPMPNPQYPSDVKTVSGAQTVKITGKNLAKMQDGDVAASGITASRSSTTGEVILNGTSTSTATINASMLYTIPIVAGETYTISANNAEANSSVSIRLNIQGISSYQNFYLNIANRTNTFTSTYTGNCTLQVRVSSGATLNNYIVKPQVELGNQASEFEPYQEQSQVINLGTLELTEIDTYQDYIWNDEGTFKIHKAIGKVVFDGSEAWSQTSNGMAFYLSMAGVATTSSTDTIPSVMSDYYTANTYRAVAGSGTTDYGIATHTSSSRISIRNKDITTIADFKTWLTSHNTTVYYALATPTDTEITDAELVGQLEALLAGSLYKGTNNIFLIPSAGADGTMTMDYRIDYEKETIVQDTMPVKLDLSDGGIINACLCRQNVQVIMRETVK